MTTESTATIARQVTNVETIPGAPDGTTGIRIDFPAIRDNKVVSLSNSRHFIATKEGRKWTAAKTKGGEVLVTTTSLKKICDLLTDLVNESLEQPEPTPEQELQEFWSSRPFPEDDDAALESVLADFPEEAPEPKVDARAKLTADEVVIIRNRVASGEASMSQIATEEGMSSTAIRNIVLGKTWAHAGGPIRDGSSASQLPALRSKREKIQDKIDRLRDELEAIEARIVKAEEATAE